MASILRRINSMTIEITLKNEETSILQNVTHVTYSDDLCEVMFHHRDWTFSTKIDKVEWMVVRK